MPPPPHPPPPPPPPPKASVQAVRQNEGDQRSGLFTEIQNGGFKLKHVTDAEKNYKQKREVQIPVTFEDLERRKALAEERRQEKAKAVEAAAKAAAETTPVKKSVFELEGDKRWVIRHQSGTPSAPLKLQINEPRMSHAIFIQQCEHVFVEVGAKCNSVIIIECKKVQVSLKSVVSSVEATNSSSIEVQVELSLPSVNLGNTHGFNLYLLNTENARNTEIVTTCSSAVNINFPDEEDNSDLLERAVPEQFVSRVVPNGKGGFKIECKPSESC